MSTTRMNAVSQTLVVGFIAGVMLWTTPVAAADVQGAMPGDEALSCEQIYAQGMAESQRDQQQRAKRNAEMKAQGAATSALVASAMLTGGATGPAAQAAAEAQADNTIALLGSQQTNPRMQRLRQLYTQKHCQAGAASPTSDAAMTCEQIAAELAPYGQQMMPNLQAMGASQQQLYAQSRAMGQKWRAEDTLLLPLAEAGAMDPTGAAKRAYQAAVIAQQAKHHAESEALANSPLAQQNKAQTQQFMAQGQELKNDAHLQHLLQLAQAKHCDRR